MAFSQISWESQGFPRKYSKDRKERENWSETLKMLKCFWPNDSWRKPSKGEETNDEQCFYALKLTKSTAELQV